MPRDAAPPERLVPTPYGPARLRRYAVPGRSAPRATLVLGHGAGGGASGGEPAARDLRALATGLPPHGLDVVLVDQPWRVAGRSVAPRPGILDEGWVAALAGLRAARWLRGGLVVGGRSAGARVACRTGISCGAEGVVALAFPLHPPGRPDRSRADELTGAGLPMLVVQGERDPFGRPAEVATALGAARCRVHVVPGADHGFAVRRSDGGPEPDWAAVLDAVLADVTAWVA